jgi:NAD(P)-dependent dehydrogenase (short-subunit alcohol dehydrogenase family)
MRDHAGGAVEQGPPLTGRVAIVIGASRGIGAATARALAAAGARVVLAARDQHSLRTVADDIASHGGSALAVPTDVTMPDSVCRTVEQTIGAWGRLDIAVNAAAGGGHRPTPLADVAIADFDSAIMTSLRGVFLAMRYEIPAMLDSGDGGSIVNVSSTAGSWPVAGLAGYVTAKSALDGLSRTAALDYAGHGIRVNILAPGPVHTEQLERAGAAARQQTAATVPIGRLGTSAEIAAAAVWLCSPCSGFVTGSTLTIDGGLTAGMSTFTPARKSSRD